MIQKLEQRVIDTDYGCGGASFSEVIDKVNEVIDFINSLRSRPKSSGNWKPSEEQPEVDLEKEIEDYCGAYENRPVPDFIEAVARHFYELGQREMRHRIMNPEYNAKVVERLKSEYPAGKEE